MLRVKLNRSKAACAAAFAIFISTCYLFSSFYTANEIQQFSNQYSNKFIILLQDEFHGDKKSFQNFKDEKKSWAREKLPPEEMRLVESPTSYGDGRKKIFAENVSHDNDREKDLMIFSSSPRQVQNSSTTDILRSAVDWSRGAWRPWPGDAQCGDVTVHYGRQLPRRALVSFPGSGNTWVRYLVEGATGLHTGSRYDDQELYSKGLGSRSRMLRVPTPQLCLKFRTFRSPGEPGFRGEKEPWNSGTTLLQKTHDFEDDDVARFEGRAVLLIRNPYRALLSYSNFFASGGHKGHSPVSFYRSLDWPVFIRMFLRRWLLTAQQWLTKGSDVQVLHYELLQEDLSAALSDLLRSLRLPVSPHRLACLQKHQAGHFRRPPLYLPDNLILFSRGTRDMIERAIRYIDYLLRQRRLPPLPLRLYEFYNSTASSSIARLPCQAWPSQHDCDLAADRVNAGATLDEVLPASTSSTKSPPARVGT